MKLYANLPLLLSAGLLSACSSVVPVSTVTSNPEQYMAQNFARANLPPQVLAALPKAAPARFARMEVQREVTTEDNSGKKQTSSSKVTLIDQGNGLYSRRTELSRNDIPFANSFGLVYQGMLPLRVQTVMLSAANTGNIVEAKNVSRIDPVPTQAGETMLFKSSQGYSQQIANFDDADRSCSFKRSFPAAELNAKLEGQALELDCEYSFRNVLEGRGTYVMLQHYGVALETEYRNTNTKNVFKVLDVTFKN
ncbi:hypothetical protein [Herbaspirillum huttiense]|uniref:hypothetical protein n=1 Tax=Herbaspirillum huttiense TaxID=863372 RepID=UPI0031DEA37E